MTNGSATRSVAVWGVAVGMASTATLLLVLVFAGGAPQAPPPGLTDPGRVPAWGLAVVPVFANATAVVTVGLALLGSGALGGAAPGRAALRLCAGVAMVWLALTVAEIALQVWQSGSDAAATQSWQVRGLLGQGALVAVAAGAAASTASHRRPWLALALSAVAVVPSLMTGHVRTDDSPVVAGAALAVHVVAASVWVGGLVALAWVAFRWRDAWAEALPRYSSIAFWCVLAVAVTGVVSALERLDLADLLTSGYGIVVVLKATLLLALAGLGWMQRRYVVRRPTSSVAAFVVLAGSELTLMALTFAVAAALAQTPPP